MKQLFILIFCALLIPLSVHARTDTVGNLQVTADSPLFSDSIMWSPGLTVSQTISIKNIGTVNHTAYIDSSNTSQTGNLADKLLFSVIHNTTELYGSTGTKSLVDFWNNGRLTVSMLVPSESTDVQLTVSMPIDADNSFQQSTASFDIRVGFVGSSDSVIVDAKSATTPILISATPDGISLPAVPIEFSFDVLGIAAEDETKDKVCPGRDILPWIIIFILVLLLLWCLLKKPHKI